MAGLYSGNKQARKQMGEMGEMEEMGKMPKIKDYGMESGGMVGIQKSSPMPMKQPSMPDQERRRMSGEMTTDELVEYYKKKKK